MKVRTFGGLLCLSTLAVLALPTVAVDAAEMEKERGEHWKEGIWRIELQGWTAFRSGRRSRTGDIGITGAVEYEIPVAKRWTVGLRTYPLFVYDQNDDGDDTVWGAAGGVGVRFYSKRDEFRGFFAEVGGLTLVASGRFDGNSGTTNFLTEGGIGWKFKSNWHTSLKIRHMSNAGLAGSNSGVNNVGLTFGYTFKRRTSIGQFRRKQCGFCGGLHLQTSGNRRESLIPYIAKPMTSRYHK